MMPLVDHSLNKSSEMTTVSNSLEVFDKYTRQEDEKESDEESFHLNLDDDETDTRLGDAATTTETEKTEKSGTTADNEDAILDKFDITAVNNDPIDSNSEDTLLDDRDHKVENGKEENATEELDNDSKETVEADRDTPELQEDGTLPVENADEDIAQHTPSAALTDGKLSVEDKDKNASQDTLKLQTDRKLDGDKDEETIDEEAKEEGRKEEERRKDETKEEIREKETEEEEISKEETKDEETNDAGKKDETKDAITVTDEGKIEDTTSIKNQVVEDASAIKDVIEMEDQTETIEMKTETEFENCNDKKNKKSNAATKDEDVEMTDSADAKKIENTEAGDEIKVRNHAESAFIEKTEKCEKDEKMNCEESTEKKKEISEKTQERFSEEPQLDPAKETPDPVTNADDDSEDLFDITAVKGMEEDNAANALEVQEQQEAIRRQAVGDDSEDASNDKPDETGDDEEEESSDKPDNTEDDEEDVQEEMEIDEKQDELDIDEKQDELDIDETTLKASCDDDKDVTVTDGDSDHSNSCVTERQNSVEEITDVVENSLDISENGGDDAPTVKLNEFTGQLEGKGSDVQNGLKDKSSEDVPSENRKRSLPDDDVDESSPKRTKTDEPAVPPLTEEEIAERKRIKSLTSLADFMRKKTSAKLSMSDLEEFCLQKVCEAIVHKSDVGDVHHQLKVQEHLIDSMRKEIQQLSKQARDLEIVNKKLTNDLKAAQGTLQKPLQPLKITRSVGLQVKFTPGNDHHYGTKRVKHSNSAAMPAKPAGNVTPTKTPAKPPTKTPTKVPPLRVAPTTPPRQVQQLQPKPATPLLSQALQSNPKRPAPNNQGNVVPKVVTTKPAENKPSPGVIDLTDEDERKDKNNRITPTKAIPLRTTNQTLRTVNTPQGIRLTTAGPQGKVPMNSVVTTNATPMLYVVSSGQGGVPQKHVLVNFQPNGMLASTVNGSAVSMLPKQGNTIQLKTLSAVKTLQPKVVAKPAPANKHPAPLPPPPPVRGAVDKTLKQVPPKPHLTIRKTDTGIILQWKMPYDLDLYEIIASYQLYAYQETSAPPSTDMWRRVGDVKALALPMACTLTQFADKNKYYFAVRPVDIHKRIGSFSDPEEISL